MAETLGHASVVVLPTYYGEGLPKVLLEAAACAKPIVTTVVRGCCEIVRDGENGYLVAPRDVPELANAIERLMGDPHLRWRLGSAGRRIVLREFTAAQVASETMDIYCRMLGIAPIDRRVDRQAA
jgi:glycosyltransferase involved in cell wall biosynthesis